jgi:NMT1-like family
MDLRLQSVALLIALAASPAAGLADDTIKVLVPQKGNWETSVPDLGQRKGIFAKHGLNVETLYTSGGGETMQALISGSADIAIATGTAAILGAFAKGAPIRPIAASMTGADDLFCAGSVQVFGRRHRRSNGALRRPASEKRQGTKSRGVGRGRPLRKLSYGDLSGERAACRAARGESWSGCTA